MIARGFGNNSCHLGGLPIGKVSSKTIYWLLAALLPAVILAGLCGAASAQEPPSGQPLRWEEIYKPGATGNIVVAPSEVNRIVASHDIVYALDTVNNLLYSSDNGGLTFNDITHSLPIGVGLRWYEIAVAPDRPQYVALVTNNRSAVFISNDGGQTWNDTSITPPPGEQIQCITISNGYSSSNNSILHDVAVGTANWTLGTGHVLALQIGGITSTWTDQILTPSGPVSAIAFSPHYNPGNANFANSDSTILATASDSTGTYLCIGTRNISAQSTQWNDPSSYPNYPVPIVKESIAFPINIIYSSIALPSNYGGASQITRKEFVSYSRIGDASNDVYRVDDGINQVDRLKVTDATSMNISSIAYFGTLISGKLLAGFVEPTPMVSNVVQVKWSVNPLGTPPGSPGTVVWFKANQPPSGPGNAQVAWSYSGAVGFCGTGIAQPPIPTPSPPPPGPFYDESAFSQSLDNGNNWTQTSLMNTSIQISDIAPAPDSRSLFMASYSEFGPESVWRSAGEPLGQYWGRLLNMQTETNRVILRLSPDYATDYTLYAVEVDNITSENVPVNSHLLEISLNRGNTWKKLFIPGPVIDMVTAGQYILYMATSGGCVRRSTDGGVTWGDKVTTGLNNINMLALGDNGHLFASSTDGWVAYSTDGGATFTEIPVPVSYFLSDIQVVPDANYAANNVIYAGGRTDGPPDSHSLPTENVTGGIWRWTIGQSAKWEQIDISIADNITEEQVSGLKVGPEGTLYALRADNITAADAVHLGWSENITNIIGRSEGMNRTLDPVYPIAELMEWDMINRTLTGSQIAFDPAPLTFAGDVPWLKLSGNAGENDLWAIDTSNGVNDNTTAIYRFRDTLCKAGPWATGPSETGCDPVTGRNDQVDFSWEQLSLSDKYELQLAKDQAFDLRVDPSMNNSENVTAVTGSILIRTDPDNVLSPAVWLPPGSLPEAGATYFWRIRTDHAATGEYIRSPWSDTGNFIVKPGFPVATPYLGPQLLSPANNCDCAFNSPIGFTWTPDKEATAYKFELSERSDMSRPLVSATVDGPAYLYSGQLRNNTIYFWRVAAVQPVPGESSATFSFHTAPASAPAHLAPKSQSIPLWVIVGSAIGALACIILLVLIFRRWGMF
ncbi:MAG: hypothetical protein WB588_00160 [Dehalococcoidia bacterium]